MYRHDCLLTVFRFRQTVYQAKSWRCNSKHYIYEYRTMGQIWYGGGFSRVVIFGSSSVKGNYKIVCGFLLHTHYLDYLTFKVDQ